MSHPRISVEEHSAAVSKITSECNILFGTSPYYSDVMKSASRLIQKALDNDVVADLNGGISVFGKGDCENIGWVCVLISMSIISIDLSCSDDIIALILMKFRDMRQVVEKVLSYDFYPTSSTRRVPLITINDIKKISSPKIPSGTYGIIHTFLYEGKRVAVKSFNDISSCRPRYGDYYKELTLLQQFDHPNIINCIAIIAGASVVMEYADQDLYTYIYDQKTLQNKTLATNVYYQISKAVKYIHSLGVVHRDIKPANILVFGSGCDMVLKLCDFGQCKMFMNDIPLCFHVTVCTLQYRAPEIMTSGGLYGYPIDIWSLGCVVYEAYTAKILVDPPYSLDDYNYISVLRSMWGTDYNAPTQRSMFSEVDDDDIAGLLCKLLVPNPQNRMCL